MIIDTCSLFITITLLGGEIFLKRSERYNIILETYIHDDYLEHSFIAGGYFIKYTRSCYDTDAEYEKANDEQNINLCVDISKNKKFREFSYSIKKVQATLKQIFYQKRF